MPGWELAGIAAVVVAYAVVSRRLDRTPVTAAIFFVSLGLLFGNKGLGWIDLGARSESVRVLAEVTLTLVLFADASRIDIGALRQEYAVPLRLLGIGLPLTILAGWALAAGLFGKLSLGEALLLAIILAPTDGALGQAVVTDTRLPSRIRQGVERRVRVERRDLRPAAPDRARGRRRRGRYDERPRCAGPRREGDRVRPALRRRQRCHGRAAEPARAKIRPDRGVVATGRAGRDGGARLRPGGAVGRKRLHRRVRRRLHRRRASRRPRDDLPARGARRACERRHVRPSVRRSSAPCSRA